MPAAPARLAVLAAAVLAASPRASAEPPRLPADAARGLAGLEDGAARLQRARAALDAALVHQPVIGNPADWEGAPAAIVAAAELLRRSEGPSLPEAGGYVASADRLRACATRAAELTRVERLQRGALADAGRCAETRALLRERLASTAAAEEARKALVRGAAGASADSDAAGVLPWRAADLERPLAGALATATAELRRWLERTEHAHAELKGRASDLGGQHAEFSRARDCVLAGSWTGVRTREGTMAGLALALAPAGATWTGTLDVDGERLPVHHVALKGSAVTLSAGEGQFSLRATLSADDRVLKGTCSSIDGPAAFTLRKQ